jgi:hypothetical protein
MTRLRPNSDKAVPHSRLSLRADEPDRERCVLKQQIALYAGVLAFSLTASGSVSAQPVQPYYPGAAHPGTVYPGYAPGLPPHEILTIIRSSGLEPLSRPMRHGPAYALRAVNPSGHEVRVSVDARTGRILQVVPVLAQRYAVPRPPGRIANVPDGYGPNSRIAVLPPGYDDSPVNGPGAGGLPAVPAPAAVPPRPAAQAGPPPLPRPRPKLAAAESTPATPVTGAVPQAAPPQVEAKESKEHSKEQTKESETTGAITPANPAPIEQHE